MRIALVCKLKIFPFGDDFETSWIPVKKITICFDYNEIISIQHVHHWHGASTHRLTPIATRSWKVADSVMVSIMRIFSLLVILSMPILNTFGAPHMDINFILKQLKSLQFLLQFYCL